MGKKETAQLLFVTAISGTSLACEASFSAQVRRESRGKCKKRGMKCSRSNFWAITRLKTLADAGWDGIACVASVSNRFIARKLERKQKKGFAPSPVIHFFFCSCPSFLDEPRDREETLATQARDGTDNTGLFFNFFVLFNRKSINGAQFCFITS